jgi:hypothetical protein
MRWSVAPLAALFALTTVSATAQAPARIDPQLAAAMEFVRTSNSKGALNLIKVMDLLIAAQIRREHPNASNAAISAFQKALREEMLANIAGYVIAPGKVVRPGSP